MSGHFWEIPEIWPDSTVFILGGGPSLLNNDLSLIHDKRVIGVNQAYKLGSWIDLLWYGDKQWFFSQLPQVKQFKGLIATCNHEVQEHRRYKRTKYVGRGKQSGIATDRRTHIAWNGNSGASAINVAYWLGAKKVVLLGFDCKLPEDIYTGKTHWHNDYEPKIDKRSRQLVDSYKRFLRYWPNVKKDADRIGLEITTTTPDSGLKDLFKYIPLEDCI
jgi:hypothetical protein